MVALITANFDDSQQDGLWVAAGYVGYANQWDYFDQLWTAALQKHGVPYFHMKEMNDPGGPFAKWLPAEKHQPEVIAFFTDLVGVIQKTSLRMISSAVWIADLKRFNGETGLSLEPYPLAAYACWGQIAQQYVDVPAMAIFDRADKVDDKLRKARIYADSDPNGRYCDNICATPLSKPTTARDVPALQAADLIAWEYRKALYQMKEWQLSSDRPQTDRKELWSHYLQWTRERTGGDPILRKSLEALIDRMPSHSVVWDWHQINDTNKFRNGIWELR